MKVSKKDLMYYITILFYSLFNIALAYVKNDKDICTGSTVQVMIREKLHDAEIVKRPFIEKRNRV